VRRRGRSSTVTRSRSRPRNRLRRDVRGYGCVLCWLGIILSSVSEHSEVPDDHDWPGRRFQCFIDNCVVDNCGAGFAATVSAPTPARLPCSSVSALVFRYGIRSTAALPRPGLLSRIRDTISAVRRYAPSAPAESPSITDTPRRGWTNAQGQHLPGIPDHWTRGATVRPSVTAPPAGTRAANGVS
jgi:hypothetical protein